jgi:hypothetical protein
MTWQKVISAKASKEAQFQVAGDSPTPHEMGMDEANGQAADVHLEGLFLKLEAKGGNQYEFGVAADATIDIHDMAADIVDAIADGKDVWVNVDFDANGGDGRVLYWADGAPWRGGDVKDDYGLSEGI